MAAFILPVYIACCWRVASWATSRRKQGVVITAALFAVALAIAGYTGLTYGAEVVLALLLVLLVVFALRLLKTRKFMPAGLMWWSPSPPSCSTGLPCRGHGALTAPDGSLGAAPLRMTGGRPSPGRRRRGGTPRPARILHVFSPSHRILFTRRKRLLRCSPRLSKRAMKKIEQSSNLQTGRREAGAR